MSIPNSTFNKVAQLLKDLIKNNKGKFAGITLGIFLGIVGLYKWYSPAGNVGLYGNNPASYISTPQGRLVEVRKLISWGYNDYAPYGMEAYLVTHQSWVADFVLQFRRLGGKDVSIIYSSASTVVHDVDYYNKQCTNDSCKIYSVAMEEEPYNTGKYAVFYQDLSTVYKYCKANGMNNYIYAGWETPAAFDSIVKYSDATWLHAYIKMDSSAFVTNIGAALYGYSKSRRSVIAIAAKRQNKKYPVRLLTSDELSFGHSWYLKYSESYTINNYQNYVMLHETMDEKNYIIEGGGQLFDEKFRI